MEIINFKTVSNSFKRNSFHSLMRFISYKNYKNLVKGKYTKVRNKVDLLGSKISKSITITSTKLGNFDSLLFTPEKEINSKKIILFCHGGGFVLGSYKSHKKLVSKIVKTTKIKAIVFNYRLAPEHQFPVQIDDTLLAYNTLIQQGYLADDIIIMGDSAGGNLCLNLLLQLKKDKQNLPAKAVLLFPWIDMECSTESISRNSKKDSLLSENAIKLFSKLTFKNLEDQKKYNLLHKDFSNLPPILIQIGTFDTLFDENMILINKLKENNNSGTAEIWDKMTHGWHAFFDVLKESEMAINNIHKFLKK